MKKLGVLLVAILFIGIASAASIDYEIIEEKVFVQADFGNVRDFEFRLPYDAEMIESESDFEVTEFAGYKILSVDSSENLAFSYITETMIEQTRTKNFFILKNTFNKSIDVRVYLPEAGILMEDFSLIYPIYASIKTDGQRIFLEWRNFNDNEIVVGYDVVKDETFLWIYLLIALLILFGIFYLFHSKKLKKQIEVWKSKQKSVNKKTKKNRKKEITRNLFGEEKQIIEYLIDKPGKECWTKEIARDLNIPKVRLSRKLRNLEQRELIERIPYGNENRIKLLKAS